jgi:bifunctional non-homologous end joining protein LigD
MSLVRYRTKRDFSKTGEPRGAARTTRQQSHRDPSRISFVIQKHAATRLHYDFRLEIDGVLKSWAVPKGIPLTKGTKNLAVQVEDHPREYGGFEGVIPEGNYGAGTVMLWDEGICDVPEGNPTEALRQGKLILRLHGHKLRGQWTLVRMRPKAEEDGSDGKSWLLIKTEDDADPVSARAEDRSVVSGRTMKQIAAQQDRLWQSNQDSPRRQTGKGAGRLTRSAPHRAGH